MVNRGDCTFVQKVRNGQHSGAAGVLIADNTCICGDPDCSITNGEIVCETQEPIMADDGSGGDISIPSFLLYKRDADKFIEELKANRPLQVEMSWSMPQPDGRVEYELFTTPTDPVSKSFLLQWQKVAIALGNRSYFTPHMFIYDGVRAGCQGANGTSNCYNLCTNSGRYCGTDPDNDLNAGISGADVVRESLRRICIWNIYGAPDGIGRKYWQYMEQFNVRCNTADYFMEIDCIKDVYKHSDIDGDRVESCMIDSGITTSDTINNKLEKEIEQQSKQGVIIIPSAFVNGAVIRGALNVNNIFSAICSGFADGTAPDVCRCNGCADVIGCIDNKLVCKGGSTGGVSYTTYPSDEDHISYRSFTVSILLLVGTLSTIGFMYYKRSQETVRSHVRDILAEYMPLQDNGDSQRMGLMPQQQQYAPQFHK
jgi:PA domain